MSNPMRSPDEVYMAYRYCMAHVVVRNAAGDLESGSAFHIGDGYYVTAGHVADKELVDFLPYDAPSPETREFLGHAVELPDVLRPVKGAADLALLSTGREPRLPTYGGDYRPHHETHVPIGGHLDDWLDEGMTLFEVVMLGYPPIPQARNPVLIAAAGHINAVVDKYGGGHPHFIVSALPRGGFSGGPVIYQDWLVGVITESLVVDGAPPELGYAAAISIEPLWNLLHDHGIYPASNADFLRAVYDGDEDAEQRLLAEGNAPAGEMSEGGDV